MQMNFALKINKHYTSASLVDPTIDVTKLTSIEIHFLLSWFCYYMSQEQRKQLRDEHPIIYKKLMKMDKPEDVQLPKEDVKDPRDEVFNLLTNKPKIK